MKRCRKEFEKVQDDDEVFEKKQKELDAAKEVSDSNIMYNHFVKIKLCVTVVCIS